MTSSRRRIDEIILNRNNDIGATSNRATRSGQARIQTINCAEPRKRPHTENRRGLTISPPILPVRLRIFSPISAAMKKQSSNS